MPAFGSGSSNRRESGAELGPGDLIYGREPRLISMRWQNIHITQSVPQSPSQSHAALETRAFSNLLLIQSAKTQYQMFLVATRKAKKS